MSPTKASFFGAFRLREMLSPLNWWSRARRPSSGTSAPSSNRTCRFPAYGFPCETVIADTSSRQSFLSEGEFHETRHSSPCGDLRGFFVRVSPFRQSALPLSISDVSFYTQNPFASTDITPLHRYYGFIRLLASPSRLRGLPSSCQNFRHASPGSTPSAPYVLCRSQTHDIGFIQSERLASGSRPSRGFDTRFTCVGTHVFVR